MTPSVQDCHWYLPIESRGKAARRMEAELVYEPDLQPDLPLQPTAGYIKPLPNR
ncbi:MAG: hypothetical protein JO235_15150 [Chroococcidiopsidaceae cyanobacterium CP_BM_RX_35]|nr:hypothetical protein [Chroococcidiopsidaceae cyanobacterium CP_BM_RX_35]